MPARCRPVADHRSRPGSGPITSFAEPVPDTAKTTSCSEAQSRDQVRRAVLYTD